MKELPIFWLITWAIITPPRGIPITVTSSLEAPFRESFRTEARVCAAFSLSLNFRIEPSLIDDKISDTLENNSIFPNLCAISIAVSQIQVKYYGHFLLYNP